MKLSMKHTLYVQREDYQELHNEAPKAHPARAHWWDLN